MGLWLLMGWGITEVILVFVYRRKPQKNLLFYSRLGFLLVFTIGFLTPWMTFGVRYIIPLVVMSALTISSGLKGYVFAMTFSQRGKVKVILRTMILMMVILIGILPVIMFPEYQLIESTGIYAVDTVSLSYTDDHRLETFLNDGSKRTVNVRYWFPKEVDETFPLIVFSHGGISTKTSNESLFNELASHGYVIVSIDHPFHSLVTVNDAGERQWVDRNYMSELQRENPRIDPSQSLSLYQDWMNLRTKDIAFVIDHIKANVLANSIGIYALVNVDSIGLIGHSLGGSAMLCLGRTREDVQAIIALESPFMCDIDRVDASRFVFDETLYPVPLLTVYSDSAWPSMASWMQYDQNVRYLTLEQPNVFHIYIEGVGHFGLTDLALTSPILTGFFDGFSGINQRREHLKTVNQFGLAFFNAYLKDQGEFET